MEDHLDERPRADNKNESQDEASELRAESKMRSNLQPARCASRNLGSDKNSGQFAKKKSKRATTEETPPEDVGTAVPVFAL